MTKKITLILILIVVLLLSMTLMVNAADQPDEKTLKQITKLMKKGNKYAGKDQLDKAFESYNKVLELSTEYAPVYLEMARLYEKQQKFDMAIENLEKSLKIQPDSTPAIDMLTKILIGMGDQLASQQQVEKANQYFLKVLEIPGVKNAAKEQLNHAFLQLGFNYSRLKNPAKSNEYLLKLLEFTGLETSDKDKFVKASYQLGTNYFNLKQFEKAEEIFSKVIKIDGLKTDFLQVYALTHFLAGLNASQLRKYKESSEYLIEYLDVTQNNPSDPYRATANYALGSNNYELLQKGVAVIKSDKKNDMRKRVAQLAKEAKNIQPYISKALELNPNFEPAYMILGNYYFLCRDYENAMQTYRTLIEKFPNSQEINTYKNFLKDIEKESKLKK
jgi:tetratricopeptide (TPR) repeat protein